MVRQRIANPLSPSSNLGAALQKNIYFNYNEKVIWGCGGMVDTTDLKSVDHIGRKGSSPFAPIFF